MAGEIFISYASRDAAAARSVCAGLEAKGLSCWMAPRNILPGEDFGAAIDSAIQSCRVMVLIFSSSANASKQMARELKLADDANKAVIPVRVEDVAATGSFRYILGAAQWMDALGGPSEEQLAQLDKTLRRHLKLPEEVPTAVPHVPTVPVPDSVKPATPEQPVKRDGVGSANRSTLWSDWRILTLAALLVAGIVVGGVKWVGSKSAPGGPAGPEPEAKVSGTPQARTRVNSVDGLTYVFVPAGKFMMGCSPGDSECADDEKPPHEVTITNGFWLGQTEVTQAAWRKAMKADSPSSFKGDQLPVESIDWNQAAAYCKAIGGRLPWEAEWEYAARAGTTQARYGSLDDVAWYSGNSEEKTHPAGQKTSNGFGLYDMLGNVWEWVADWYQADYYKSGRSWIDPHGPESGNTRVVRGGSWLYNSRLVRVSGRGWYVPSYRLDDLGVRCVGEFR
jgi:formylglycine-generating enzyme required for sulfatase activity